VLYIISLLVFFPTTFVTAQVEPWLFSIGYSLCFGTILAKMYRVHYIFSNPTAEKRVCKIRI